MLDSYRERRDLLINALSQIDGFDARVPDGTFYAFVRYDLPLPSTELAAELKQARVAVRPGSEYGAAGAGPFRLSSAAGQADIIEAAQRIERYMTAARV